MNAFLIMSIWFGTTVGSFLMRTLKFVLIAGVTFVGGVAGWKYGDKIFEFLGSTAQTIMEMLP